jgi:hypothetical protein
MPACADVSGASTLALIASACPQLLALSLDGGKGKEVLRADDVVQVSLQQVNYVPSTWTQVVSPGP